VIYFAQADGTDFVKIGHTRGDPAKRLTELQTGCPHRLVLLASVDGGEDDEGRWHERFASDRVGGEWFRMSWRLCLAIARAEACAASPVAGITGGELLFAADARKVFAPQFPCRTCRGRSLVGEGDSGTACAGCNGTGFMNWRQGVEAANEAPVAMVCEKRHHKGEPDVSYPVVFCMVCGRRITDAREGNAYWAPGYEKGQEEKFYASRWHVVFAHKECNHGVSRMSSWMPLEDFVTYLGRNLRMKKMGATIGDLLG
jgi:hypothetical protein